MIDAGARPVPPQRWAGRSRFAKALSWVAYGIVRVGMGMLRYGGDEWWRGRDARRGQSGSDTQGARKLICIRPRIDLTPIDSCAEPLPAPSSSIRAPRSLPSPSCRNPRAANAPRGLAHARHAAPVPVGVQGPRDRGARVPRRGQGRERRRAAADEADRRQPGRAHGRARGAARAARRVRPAARYRRPSSPSCASSCSPRSRSARCARSRSTYSGTCTRCRCASTSRARPAA